MVKLTDRLHQLAIFHAAAQLGSFSAAAEKLDISQPAVSVQVRRLERALDLVLLERSGRRLRLTEAGEAVHSFTQRIFALVDDLSAEVEARRGLARGRLVVGASSTVGEYLLPEVLGRFRERYPGIEVELAIGNTTTITQRVRQHQLDFGFVGASPPDESLITVPFADDEIVLFAAPQHRLARRRVVLPSDLAAERFLMREAGSATREWAESALRRLEVTPQVALELGSNEAVKRAAAAGLGLGALSRVALGAELAAGQVVVLNVAGWHCRRTFWVLYHPDRQLGRPERAFLDLLGIAPPPAGPRRRGARKPTS